MKNEKLSLEKLQITRLTNANSILGGGDDPISDKGAEKSSLPCILGDA